MGKIILLSEEISSQIAAGEVVERPANVLKELLENSLDAGAKNIRVNILAAGRKLIQVTDDGNGMDKPDLELSVARYATSKIKDITDLNNLSTFGFRGEALAAISLVSHLTISSHSVGSPESWQLTISGGKNKKIVPVGQSIGTTVKVADLFFNTPARKKFLRSDNTELSHLYRTLEEVALANWSASFILTSNEKIIYNLKAKKSYQERAADILGENFADFIEIADLQPAGKIFGFISRPQQKNASRLIQYLFVNRRPVINRRLSYAIAEAVRQIMPRDFRPGFIIFLDLKPESVDVNIHPTKREVRISNEYQIYEWLYHTVKNSFIKQSPSLSPATTSLPKYEIYPEKVNWPVNFSQLSEEKVTEPAKSWMPEETGRWQYLGQIFSRYILAADDQNVFFIDQHAAQEILLYEQFLSEWKKGIVSQPLLIPIIKNYPRTIFEKIKNNLHYLNDLGWQIEEFGTNALRCLAQPQLFSPTLAEKILDEILPAIAEAEFIAPNSTPQQVKEKIATLACHQAIRTHDTLTIPEIRQLLLELEKRPELIACPHGRPVIIAIKQSELDKKFQRT